MGRAFLLIFLVQREELLPERQPGVKHTLMHKTSKKEYQGRLWYQGDAWLFKEDVTGFSATVRMSGEGLSSRQCETRDKKLLLAMNAEHERAKSKAKKQAKAEASKADVPKTAGDMSIRGTSKDGKLIYSWGDADRGRVEVEVTPRKHAERKTKRKRKKRHTL